MSASDQTAARLLNLIIALMVHPRGLSREQLMAAGEIAEERTFERTKEALRSALGVALEESDQGHYRLGAQGYAMPPLQFTPPEHAAIALALGAWRGSEVEWAARAALTKLAPLTAPDPDAPGSHPTDDQPTGADPAEGLDMALYAPAEGANQLITAIAECRRVDFDYVTGATGQLARRRLEPWRLTKRGGTWYAYGFDLDRRAERVYNLNRIIGPVKVVGPAAAFTAPDPELVGSKLKAALDGRGSGPALVRAAPRAGRVLALQGAQAEAAVPSGAGTKPRGAPTTQAPAGQEGDAGTGPNGIDGGALWRLPDADPFELAAWGRQIEVIEPAALRQEVHDRWRAAAQAHRGPARDPQAYQQPVKPARHLPKEGGAGRAARLVSLVSYLRDRDSVPLTELAARFGISPEEVHRDLYLLWTDVGRSRAGGDLLDFAWSGDEQEVALIDSQGLDRPVRLSPVEAIAVIAALRSLEQAGGLTESSAAAAARAKLEEALGAVGGIDFNLPPAGPALQEARQAIAQGRRLAFDYVNQAGQPSRRRVDPLEVFGSGDHWLMAAWDLSAQAERHFRLDRMAGLRTEPEPAETHPYRPRRTGWSGRADLVVDAVFAPRERWRAEELETLAPPLALAGGALQVRIGVVNPDWITAMALGGGGMIEVLGPPELRRRIAEAATAAFR
ncbi:MAG: WYL domain-containing protein [Bifidobacteriaceae bacterium]|nr:WYL domain-containing protein [Bifidobacteriaceae bacterium]